MKNKLLFISALIVITLLFSFNSIEKIKAQTKFDTDKIKTTSDTKPRVLWWWFAGKIKQKDVKSQLIWLKENNIGGVMIFFLYPPNKIKKDTIHYFPRYEFLGGEFTNICAYTKKECNSLKLSCNFLCGTGWPFGGSFVERDDATLSWTNKGLVPMRTFGITWEWPKKGYVIDHMNSSSLDRYFARISNALIPSLIGNRTYLECDSWEIAESEPIWTHGFDKAFKERYGYDILPYVSTFSQTDKKDSVLYKMVPYISKLYDYDDKAMFDVRYDYYKLVSEYVINNFYKHFTKLCNSVGSGSILECNGTPADIIDSYSGVDIPMTEAMLFEPNYSKIVASAACLGGKNIIASETFTCAYGFPRKYEYKEQVADMKLVADALFANGANLIYWHGFPLNSVGSDSLKYYATVQVSPKSKLMNGFKEFNAYMDKVSSLMQKGNTYGDVAVYLPMEDRWSEGIYSKDFFNHIRPDERNWHFSKYQMRYEYFPEELNGYPMLWINSSFINNAKFENNILKTGNTSFRALYINVNYLPYETLCSLVELAKKGLPVCLKNDVKEPGRNKHKDYSAKLAQLKSFKNVSSDHRKIYSLKPLLEGENLPEFWVRKDTKDISIFFANPKTKDLKYPVKYGQSLQNENITKNIVLNINNKSIPIELIFKPYQSLMIRIDENLKIHFEDISFMPPVPLTKPE